MCFARGVQPGSARTRAFNVQTCIENTPRTGLRREAKVRREQQQREHDAQRVLLRGEVESIRLVEEQREDREPAEALELEQLRRGCLQPEHGVNHEGVDPYQRQCKVLQDGLGSRRLRRLPVFQRWIRQARVQADQAHAVHDAGGRIEEDASTRAQQFHVEADGSGSERADRGATAQRQ